jgi:hypothetical protein
VRGFKRAVITLLLVLFLGLPPSPALAATGLPDSPEFGYGARLDVWGQQINPAVSAAAAMGLDWLAVDFNWGRYWPEASVLPDLNNLYQVMGAAKRGNLHVMISITNAPAWAITSSGPDPNLTAGLVLSLYRLFPDTLLAAELFPAANQSSAWGAKPNPQAYADMLKLAQVTLYEAGADLVLVAGGLTPLGPEPAEADIDEITYLKSLYTAGASAFMPVVSVRLTGITGDPLAAPQGSDSIRLRHYEQLRKVMLENEHASGLIWITGFAWPEGISQANGRALINLDEQARWLNQAYRLLRSQLYIGVAFFDQLNPPTKRKEPGTRQH